jgi:chromosome segregation ATPase
MQEFDVTKCMEAVVNVMNNPRRLKKVDGLINNLIKIVDRYVKEGIEQADLLNAVKRLEVENTRLAERIASKDSEILRLNNEKTEILRESGWLKDEVKRLNDEILRLKDELLRVRTEKERLERENGELNAKVTELMRKNGFLEDEKVRLTNEINVRSDEILKIKNEILELKKSISTLESEIQKRDQIIQDLKKKEAELEGIKSLPLYKLYKKVF